MLYNVLAMLAFLYGVCLWDTFKSTDLSRERMKKVEHKEPYIKTWWDLFVVNNFIYFTIAIPAVVIMVVLVEIIHIFFLYY